MAVEGKGLGQDDMNEYRRLRYRLIQAKTDTCAQAPGLQPRVRLARGSGLPHFHQNRRHYLNCL